MRSTTGLNSLAIAIAIVISVVGAAMTPSANAAPPTDACSLLTQPQVSDALGASVAAGKYIAPTFTKTCTWNATTNGAGYVTVMLEGIDEYQGGKQMGQVKSVSITSISGIGDDAYFLALGDNVGLIVKKGNVAFKVAVYVHLPLEQKRAMEKTLAQQIVSKL